MTGVAATHYPDRESTDYPDCESEFDKSALSSLNTQGFALRVPGMQQQGSVLGSYPVLRTRNLDEARAAVSARYCDHKLDLCNGGDLRVTHNHVRGGHVSLNLLSYGADVTINPGELQDFYLLQIPLAGVAQISHRSEDITASAHCATILNPDRPSQMIWHGGCQKLMVQIDADFLTRVAQEATGVGLPGAVRFNPSVDLKGQAGLRLRQLSISIAYAIEAGVVDFTKQDLAQLAMERDLTLALLEAQPSNVSHLFQTPDPQGAVHYLRRAVDYIHSSLHEALTLDDIAAAAQVHPRTLQAAFKDQFRCTPMQYLRDQRLNKARYHLLQRRNRLNVSQIAYDCGYNHLGRFSRDYRARFGQAPRDTH